MLDFQDASMSNNHLLEFPTGLCKIPSSTKSPVWEWCSEIAGGPRVTETRPIAVVAVPSETQQVHSAIRMDQHFPGSKVQFWICSPHLHPVANSSLFFSWYLTAEIVGISLRCQILERLKLKQVKGYLGKLINDTYIIGPKRRCLKYIPKLLALASLRIQILHNSHHPNHFVLLLEIKNFWLN